MEKTRQICCQVSYDVRRELIIQIYITISGIGVITTSAYLHICIHICICIMCMYIYHYLSINLSIYLSINPSIYITQIICRYIQKKHKTPSNIDKIHSKLWRFFWRQGSLALAHGVEAANSLGSLIFNHQKWPMVNPQTWWFNMGTILKCERIWYIIYIYICVCVFIYLFS